MATVEKDITETSDKIAKVKAIVKKRAKAIKSIGYKEGEISNGKHWKELSFAYPERTVRLGTLFSGIGAIEMALKYLNIQHEIIFACDNGERLLPYTNEDISEMIKGFSDEEKNEKIRELYSITGKPNLVKASYCANYQISDERWYEDVRYLNANSFMNQVDLFVGGSPCQSFSYNGKQAGLNDVRGTLFYE